MIISPNENNANQNPKDKNNVGKTGENKDKKDLKIKVADPNH